MSDSPAMISAPRLCPKCGSEIPSDAPEGGCTFCLLQAGIGNEKETVHDSTRGADEGGLRLEPLVATSEKDQASTQASVKWGAQKMIMHDAIISGVTGFGVQRSPDQKQPTSGFGALPGSGVSF